MKNRWKEWTSKKRRRRRRKRRRRRRRRKRKRRRRRRRRSKKEMKNRWKEWTSKRRRRRRRRRRRSKKEMKNRWKEWTSKRRRRSYTYSYTFVENTTQDLAYTLLKAFPHSYVHLRFMKGEIKRVIFQELLNTTENLLVYQGWFWHCIWRGFVPFWRGFSNWRGFIKPKPNLKNSPCRIDWL